MIAIDYIVLVVYFLVLAGIGIYCMRRVKKQEDFFLGGRSFGKVIQAFAAFGAGTGANDPVVLGRTTYTSGLSGIWGVLMWLFVTPFYWIFGVWYRRMRHLTLGDWFVERFESRGLGAAYTLFGLYFYAIYLSVAFSAVGKVCAPLIGATHVVLPMFAEPVPIEGILVPLIGLVVIVYGALGGMRAAYLTDLIQGVFIIFLSIMLIPFGLKELVEKFGDPANDGILDGFRILHEQVPASYFQIIESPRGGEFPLHYIVAITILNMMGIVVQPHFIATGGGSAKSEESARVGLVVGNFMKRLCTVGWALTGLIVLALLADNLTIAEDPDRAWGVAALEILGPLKIGLVGLMLACLLAALMSSADCYMLVTSGLVVRNLYVGFLNPQASERECIWLARAFSFVLITLAVIGSLVQLDVFEQLKLAWEIPILFAAPFWIGMFWRRAGRLAAWGTIAFSTIFFFVVPLFLPLTLENLGVTDLRASASYLKANDIVTTTLLRPAAPADVAKSRARRQAWENQDPTTRGEPPEILVEGEIFRDSFVTGGKAIYWRDGLTGPDGEAPAKIEISRELSGDGSREVIVERFTGELRGKGNFNQELLLYDLLGIDLTRLSNAALETMRLPPRLILPFLVMALLSLLTPRNSRESLDRFYVKMKTPTRPDPEEDLAEMEKSYATPDRFDDRRLFPAWTGLEFSRPSLVDIGGFILCFLGTFAIIALAIWVASIGS